MAQPRPAVFVVASNDATVLRENLLASPLFQEAAGHQIVVQQGFPSAGAAYNNAIDQARHDLMIFVHQDVFLPASWMHDLTKALEFLERTDPNWSVLGCYGVAENGVHWGHVYSSGLGILGKTFDAPAAVRTLDELILIFRKSSGLRFDPALPHYHLYGTDICLQAAKAGHASYSIPAFCVHNTDHFGVLPQEFYSCYEYIKRKWRAQLPIQTPCILMSRWDLDLRVRKMKEFRLVRRAAHRQSYRSEAGEALWKRIEKEPSLAGMVEDRNRLETN